MRIPVILAGLVSAAALSTVATAQAPKQEPAKQAAKPLPSDLVKRKGWQVHASKSSFGDLVKKLEEAIKKNKMGLVNAASASDNLKAKGVTIAGNRVVGVFRPDFARRMLAASVAAGIEAPIRFYVTENADGTATLSYRTPSAVFAPYMTRRNPDLRAMAKELDAIFAQITLDALGG
jgi:uncharacterized protein (DUF302 family)